MKAKIDLIYEGMSDEEFEGLIAYLQTQESIKQVEFYTYLEQEGLR